MALTPLSRDPSLTQTGETDCECCEKSRRLGVENNWRLRGLARKRRPKLGNELQPHKTQEPDATAANLRAALKGTMMSLLQSPELLQMGKGIKRKVDQRSESSADEEKEGKGTNSEEP